MSDLHPAARALIDAAKRGEGSFPSEARARVRRSVLRRAVAVGAAVATTSTASAASKASALVAAWTSPLAVSGVVAALAGVAFFVLRAGSTLPEAPRSAPPAPSHVIARVARSVPSPVSSFEAPPAIVSPVPSGVSREPVLAVPAASPSGALPLPKPPAFAASPPPALAARSRPATTAAVPVAAGPAAEAIESPVVRTADEALGDPAGTTPFASGVRTAPAAADLAEDLDLLRQVRASLRAGHSEAALSLLDHAGRRLEAGPLAEEAQVARVSALCQLGRVADARLVTDRFLAAWPTSPLAARLRGGCAALGINSKPGAD